jgi:hypothetical protein
MINFVLLAKASRSPDGENATACTQPPLGEPYSPQTVLNGSFSPQTVGAGLQKDVHQVQCSEAMQLCPLTSYQHP